MRMWILEKFRMEKTYNYHQFRQRATRAINKHQNSDLRHIVLKRMCYLLGRFDNYLQHEAITEWSENFKISRQLLLAYTQGEEKPKLSKSDELREYLQTFSIRQNAITGEQEITKNKKEYSFDELKYHLEQEGYQIKHLAKFLDVNNKNITVVKTYNPLKDFMLKLAENYKGEQLISKLASCIPATNFKDKPETDFYQKRLEYYLQKWLYKTAGQSLGIQKNDAMLLWVEPEGGSGKSYLNRWLFSLPEFKEYYIRIGENSSYIGFDKISKNKFIVDWDELPLSKRRYQAFKSYIAAEELQIYEAKKGYTTHTKNSNYIGSTNKANRKGQSGYLLEPDPAMMRRIIPIDITGRIDYERYLNEIDLYQLWGEAANGILTAKKANNKELLTWECDWNDLREQNRRYIKSSVEADKNVLLSFISRADAGQGQVLSAKDLILVAKKKGIKIKLSPEQIGRFLRSNGFIPGRKKDKGRGYWVALK